MSEYQRFLDLKFKANGALVVVQKGADYVTFSEDAQVVASTLERATVRLRHRTLTLTSQDVKALRQAGHQIIMETRYRG